MYMYTCISVQENECRISIHDQIEENVILQIRLAALDFQRANESITLEMLLDEKVCHSVPYFFYFFFLTHHISIYDYSTHYIFSSRGAYFVLL